MTRLFQSLSFLFWGSQHLPCAVNTSDFAHFFMLVIILQVYIAQVCCLHLCLIWQKSSILVNFFSQKQIRSHCDLSTWNNLWRYLWSTTWMRNLFAADKWFQVIECKHPDCTVNEGVSRIFHKLFFSCSWFHHEAKLSLTLLIWACTDWKELPTRHDVEALRTLVELTACRSSRFAA